MAEIDHSRKLRNQAEKEKGRLEMQTARAEQEKDTALQAAEEARLALVKLRSNYDLEREALAREQAQQTQDMRQEIERLRN